MRSWRSFAELVPKPTDTKLSSLGTYSENPSPNRLKFYLHVCRAQLLRWEVTLAQERHFASKPSYTRTMILRSMLRWRQHVKKMENQWGLLLPMLLFSDKPYIWSSIKKLLKNPCPVAISTRTLGSKHFSHLTKKMYPTHIITKATPISR